MFVLELCNEGSVVDSSVKAIWGYATLVYCSGLSIGLILSSNIVIVVIIVIVIFIVVTIIVFVVVTVIFVSVVDKMLIEHS